MASDAAALSRLVDRTRVPDPALQRHAVAAFFRHLLSLPAPLPEAAHDAASTLLASPHPAVAAHAAASVARLAASRPDLLPQGLALPLLIAPLAASPSPRLASCLVKAVSALAACALRSGSRFPPHDHPFVQALASGADGARAELVRQAAGMVAEGQVGIVGFLRPFVMFSVVRKGDAAFARDLIGALAAAASATGKAGVAIPALKLLEESMLHFGRGDDREIRLWLSSAECLVDAYVVLLKKLAHAQMPIHDAQASSATLMEALLSQCSFHQKFLGVTSAVLGLSKHLFSVQKDLGLCYLPEISIVLSSLSYSLSGLEFEHEQLAGLKLLAFLIEWKHENVLERKEQKHHLSDELLCVMAVINLAISPSKSVKAVAYHVLSRFSLLVLDLPASHSSEQQDISTDYHISKPALILPKLLRHLWSQPSSAAFIFMKHTATNVSPDPSRKYSEARCWTHQLNEYLTVLRRQKLTLDGMSSKKTSSVAISSLIGSVASVLVMHPKLGTSAIESLAVLGASDPRLGMPLFVVILFYSKILCSNSNFSTEISLSLLESLPSLAIHGFVLPLALQWISPMLKRDTNPVLYAVAVRLLCKIWIVTDWAFPNLQDKWRNMNVTVTASSSRDKARTAMKKTRAAPKNNDHSAAISTVTSDADDEIVDVKPIASVSSEAWNTSSSKKSHSRLDNIIMEAIKNLNEPTGSHRTTIANYIEEQYWPPSDFDHLLSAKLKDLATSGKLIKVNRKYRIAPSSPRLEGRSPKMLLLEDVQKESLKVGSDASKSLTRYQVDAELARMASMTPEAAAAAAARAVAEAEAIMAEAEAAAREAEVAEAEAQAAQAFAEAALLTLKNRNAAKLMAQG